MQSVLCSRSLVFVLLKHFSNVLKWSLYHNDKRKRFIVALHGWGFLLKNTRLVAIRHLLSWSPLYFSSLVWVAVLGAVNSNSGLVLLIVVSLLLRQKLVWNFITKWRLMPAKNSHRTNGDKKLGDQRQKLTFDCWSTDSCRLLTNCQLGPATRTNYKNSHPRTTCISPRHWSPLPPLCNPDVMYLVVRAHLTSLCIKSYLLTKSSSFKWGKETCQYRSASIIYLAAVNS